MKKVALLFVAVLFATVTFAQSNMPIDPKTEKITFRKVINTVGSEDAVFKKVLQLADEGFTAFLVVISDWTPRLLQAIRKRGLRIPEDISVITYEYDNSAYQEPPLTTIEYNYEQLVRKAIEQLKKEIAGKKIVPEIQISCKLNIRNSTAALPRKRKKQ